MSNIRPPEEVLRKPVACWLTERDYDRLRAAADSYGIRVAVFIRSVLVDALADEDEIKASRTERNSGSGEEIGSVAHI